MAPRKPVVVRPVWEANLKYEFHLIRQALNHFPYASMDTEFPGVIHPPPLSHNHKLSPLSAQQTYQLMRKNVNDTKLIQLGLTLSDYRGNLPDFGSDFCYIWEFNFREFDVNDKLHQNVSSIELLKQQGIDFKKNKEKGIDAKHFAWLLKGSGLIRARYLTPRGLLSVWRAIWITFHGSYDFGHLVKILTQRDLPDDFSEFMGLMKMYFGVSVYDMKHMAKYCDGLYGGLEKIATSLRVDRVAGKSHQAGSDSLLTMQTFVKLKETYFGGKRLDRFRLKLFGLEVM